MASKRKMVPDSTISQDDAVICRRESTPFFDTLSHHNAALRYVSIRERTYDEREINDICLSLVEWIANPLRTASNYKIGQFLRSHGISWHSCATLKKNWPQFERAYDFAVQTLGDHREWMGLHHEWDVKMVMFTMPLYDPDWKEETIRLAKLRQQETMESGIRVVHVPVYMDKEKELTNEELPSNSVDIPPSIPGSTDKDT